LVSRNLLGMLALFASFFAFCVIGLGVFTRLIDAGLGCPDWPGCYGHFVVSSISGNTTFVAYKAWAEMIHRYFAGCLGLLMLSIFILSFRKKYRTFGNILLAVCLLLLLSYQILLGMLTVTLQLLPIIVTQHLLGGFLILSVLWLVFLINKEPVKNNVYSDNVAPMSAVFAEVVIASPALFAGRGNLDLLSSGSPRPNASRPRDDEFSFSAGIAVPRWMLFGAIMGVIILFLQISLGAWTSTNYASLSCLDFPFCENNHPAMTMYLKQAYHLFSPVGINYEGGVFSIAIRQTIQMIHRFGALIFTVYILLFVSFGRPVFSRIPTLSKWVYLILGLLSVQLCLGISNVIFKLPLVTAISHTLVAVLLLLSMITVTYKLLRAPSP